MKPTKTPHREIESRPPSRLLNGKTNPEYSRWRFRTKPEQLENYNNSEKRKACWTRYNNSEKGKSCRRRYNKKQL
jgi:hypothetical protein